MSYIFLVLLFLYREVQILFSLREIFVSNFVDINSSNGDLNTKFFINHSDSFIFKWYMCYPQRLSLIYVCGLLSFYLLSFQINTSVPKII
jgi:hypothetical protein